MQAEFAIEQKNFDDAVDLYEEGLRGTPLWPEGHFNRAMILGELVAAAGSFGKEGKAFGEALLEAVQEKRAELAESAPETIASIVQSNMVDEFQAVASVLMNRTPSGGVFVSVLYSFSADVTKGEQVGGQSTFSIGPTGTVFGAEASPSVKRCFGRDGLGR